MRFIEIDYDGPKCCPDGHIKNRPVKKVFWKRLDQPKIENMKPQE
jgi:hypothetical protein